MSLFNEQELIRHKFEHFSPRLCHQAILFDIYEGNLLTYVLDDLRSQLSQETFNQAKHRVAPINILKRVVEKLARLYSSPPTRKIFPENAQPLLEFYEKSFDINTAGMLANEFFNLFKSCAFEPFLDSNLNPRLRVIPSDRFFAFSTNPSDPMEMTHFVKVLGKQTYNGKEKTILYVYTNEEFMIMNSDGEVEREQMSLLELDGLNPYGKIPFAYQVKSRTTLNPPLDTDTLCMTKLFPILLTDLNYAVMFQSFSIMYGIDLDEENLKMAPNAFWRFKSDPTTQNKPEVGMIKPQVDSDKVIQLIQAELAMWLQSKNIRPGAVGDATTENFASGISKMVDEMDTVDERQKQIPFFKQLEQDLWDLILNHMHPVWSRSQGFPIGQQFPPGAQVFVEFKDQLPLQNRDALLDTLIKEFNIGFTTPKIAVQKLNPELDENDVDQILAEVKAQNTIEIPEEQLLNGQELGSENAESLAQIQ